MCKKTEKFLLLTLFLILISLTVIGSFFDYEIANAVYIGQTPGENFFGILFAFIGIIPTFVGWSFLGASILYLSSRVDSLNKKRWLIALSVLLFILSFFYFCNTLMMVNDSAFSVHWWVAYPIGVAVIFLAACLGYRLSEKSTNENLLQTVLTLTLISVVTMIIIMSTKEIMDRPRFRFVLESGEADCFKNWWQSGSEIKASFASDTLSDEFSSFPSGHSAYSMFAVFLFPAFADYVPKLKKYRSILFVLGFLWWTLTAFSRMTVGAHYLTDVSVAAIVTLIGYTVTVLLKNTILRRIKK